MEQSKKAGDVNLDSKPAIVIVSESDIVKEKYPMKKNLNDLKIIQ